MTQASAQHITLPISGMGCGGCVRSVEKALNALPGISNVAVSLEAAQVVVVIDPQRVTREELVTAIEDAGFDVPADKS